ncbi:MAG TPA: PEP-CTERM sorting domain-containing protein [Humisphaera sp.]
MLFCKGLNARSRPLAAVAALLLPACPASAAVLTNGNFEAPTGTDSSTTTFPSWGESTGAAAIRATTALSGSTSALLTGTNGTVGTLSQTVDPITGTFDLSFSFAAVNPGGATAGTSDRALQLLLTGSNGAQINLIVIRGSSSAVGSVQIYNGSFQSIASQVDKVNFSTSLDSPVVNTLRLTGSVGGGYTVATNGTQSGAVSYYQGGTAPLPTDFKTVNFTTVNAATVNYVVDNVTLVPEPAGAGLLAAAAAGGLAVRRRRRRQAD